MLYREIIAVCSQIHTKHINTLCGQSVELLTSKKSVKNILKMPERMFVLSISSPLPACIVNNQQINTVSGLGQGSVPGSVPLPEIYISRNLPPPPPIYLSHLVRYLCVVTVSPCANCCLYQFFVSNAQSKII